MASTVRNEKTANKNKINKHKYLSKPLGLLQRPKKATYLSSENKVRQDITKTNKIDEIQILKFFEFKLVNLLLSKHNMPNVAAISKTEFLGKLYGLLKYGCIIGIINEIVQNIIIRAS